MECNSIELAVKVGVHNLDETRSVHFQEFIDDCVTGPPDDYSVIVFWVELASREYISSNARGKNIRYTTYRLLHRLISISLMHHKNNDRVLSTDLLFLWMLVTPGRNLNL